MKGVKGWPVKHGLYGTPEYSVWAKMRRRCYDPKERGYADYGGRGIVVCRRWRMDVAAFVADMGPRPTKQHTIDRIDTNGNYEPGNCRWATRAEQNRNKRSTRLVTAFGRTMSIAGWADYIGVPYSFLYARLDRGWAPERAIGQPPAAQAEGNNWRKREAA